MTKEEINVLKVYRDHAVQIWHQAEAAEEATQKCSQQVRAFTVAKAPQDRCDYEGYKMRIAAGEPCKPTTHLVHITWSHAVKLDDLIVRLTGEPRTEALYPRANLS